MTLRLHFSHDNVGVECATKQFTVYAYKYVFINIIICTIVNILFCELKTQHSCAHRPWMTWAAPWVHCPHPPRSFGNDSIDTALRSAAKDLERCLDLRTNKKNNENKSWFSQFAYVQCLHIYEYIIFLKSILITQTYVFTNKIKWVQSCCILRAKQSRTEQSFP